jgi:DivIVA domain-containing protein
MLEDRIALTSNDVLEREFKIDTRGYRPQEVDKYLDLVIKDYDEFTSIVKSLENDKKSSLEEIIRLKQEIRSLKTKLDVMKETSGTDVNSADLLKRLSNLEKIIYGK